MTGVVRDDEHLVSQRRYEQEIHLRHHARHLAGHFAPQAIGLHEIHGREKTRLAEEVGPGIGHLHLELVGLSARRQFLECRCRFGEEYQVERVVGPIGERDRRRHHTERPCSLERRAVDVRRRRFFHPTFDVADAQLIDGHVGIERERCAHARDVARVGTADGVQHEHRVFHGARHWPEFVERPAERHRAGAWHAPVRRAETGDAAAHAGAHDAAASLAAYREGDEPRGSRRAGTSARS